MSDWTARDFGQRHGVRAEFRYRGGRLTRLQWLLICYAILQLIDLIDAGVLAGQMGSHHHIVQGRVVALSLLAWIIQNHQVSPAAAETAGWVSTRIA